MKIKALYRNLFIIFLLNSLAGFMAAYLPIGYIPILALTNDFVLVSLAGGLKENIAGGTTITYAEMMGYGKRFFLRAVLAHLAILSCGILVTIPLIQLVSDLNSWYKLAFVIFSLVSYFLAFVLSSLLYFDAPVLKAFRLGLAAFLKLGPESLTLFVFISLLSYLSISLHSQLLDIICLLVASACIWYAYLNTFTYFSETANT